MNATHGGTTLTAYKFRSMYIYPNWVHFCFKPLQFNTYTQLLEQLLFFINILCNSLPVITKQVEIANKKKYSVTCPLNNFNLIIINYQIQHYYLWGGRGESFPFWLSSQTLSKHNAYLYAKQVKNLHGMVRDIRRCVLPLQPVLEIASPHEHCLYSNSNYPAVFKQYK